MAGVPERSPGPGRILALVRALMYASVFVVVLLILLPAGVLDWAGVSRPDGFGPMQVAGLVVILAGGALAAWCVLTFALVGRGTPAPFDPPRRLVVSGPYRFVRNPMYLGAILALAGAALFYGSIELLGYTVVFAMAAHVMVRVYEEPTLGRLFGAPYDEYRRRAGRWLPAIGLSGDAPTTRSQ